MDDQMLYYLSAYGPIVVMIVAFYYIIYRPGKQEKEKRAKMLANLHKGNRVVTIGGIYGQIIKIDKKMIDLQIADKVVIKVTRAAIQTNISQQNKENKAAGIEPEIDDDDVNEETTEK